MSLSRGAPAALLPQPSASELPALARPHPKRWLERALPFLAPLAAALTLVSIGLAAAVLLCSLVLFALGRESLGRVLSDTIGLATSVITAKLGGIGDKLKGIGNFKPGNWGSLASFGARPYKGSKKIYGSYGNSFVAVVEFGKTVRAKAVTAGGESGDVGSKHFNDQAERYSTGGLREVYFYPSQLESKTERRYSPGK